MNEKLEKFLKPAKYREKKAKDFLSKIGNPNSKFEKFKGETEYDCIRYIYGEGTSYLGVKGISEVIYNILYDELRKTHYLNKAVKNKDSSYKYLSAIERDCRTLYTMNKKSGLQKGIDACTDLKNAFRSAYLYNDRLKISFLSEKNVKEYMKAQYEILDNAIDKMNKIKKNR